MHHSFHVSVPAAYTDELVDELRELDDVVSLSVQRGASVKPPGDVVDVEARNAGGDRLLELLSGARERGSLSIASSTVDSIVDTEHAEALARDVDEAPWEDMETSLRHHSQLSFNYLLTMALGGAIASASLLMTTTTQATALVAAAVIAPGFEPLAKLPLGLVLRRSPLLLRGAASAITGYVALVAAAAVTMLALHAAGYGLPTKLLANPITHEITHPTALTLVISAAGAVAGATMIAAHRVTLLAGPLIALQLIPAGALVGAALALGHSTDAAEALGRLGIDVGFVVLTGVVIFGIKQLFVHRRKPVV